MPLSIFTISEYAYCPRSCFYYLHHFYSKHTINNDFIQDGAGLHAKKLDFAQKWEKSEKLMANINLYSEKYGLVGKIDLIGKSANELYPIECKRGKVRNYPNLKLQLILEAICIEEMFQLQIKKGYLYFFSSNRRERINISVKDKNDAKKLILTIKNNLNNITFFNKVNSNLCYSCSYNFYCN